MDGYVQYVVPYIVLLVILVINVLINKLYPMEEILQLLRENNYMLKLICKYLASQGSVEYQDNKAFTMNLIADILTDGINSKK